MPRGLGTPTLAGREFELLNQLIYQHTGITLNESKVALLESRLARRLRHLGMDSYSAYTRHLKSETGASELSAFINAITTNKTSFFREPHHFEFLARQIVPELVARANQRGEKRIRIWSAGCSMGQEPYSIAMTLRRALGPLDGWDIRILASDIDTEVLAKTEAGVYSEREISEIPDEYRDLCFKPLGSERHQVRPELMRLVTVRRINLIERPWPIKSRFDVIFCRNTVIYFDRPTQQKLYEAFWRLLAPTGYFVAGHSENLHSVSRMFTSVGSTVYRPVKGAPEVDEQHSAVVAEEKRKDVAIRAGELHATEVPTLVRTVLGSCVAACLYDPLAKVGGANHFMLPEGGADAWLPARFGVHAMEMLINSLMKLGAQRSRLVAKIFGGARVLGPDASSGAISRNNAEFAARFLRDEGIPVAAQKLGGERPLLLHFQTDTGRAFVRVVEPARAEVVREEASYLERLIQQPQSASSDVTFF